MNKFNYNTVLFFCAIILSATHAFAQEIFFTETFEDANFASRGWYDNTGVFLSETEHIANSTRSAEFHFNQGAQVPLSGEAMRKKFTETESLYVRYYVKYSTNWEGSNRGYHPHEFYILTNYENDYSGPAYTHLTIYIEQTEGEPKIELQDGRNIDLDNIGVDLTGVTENRAVAGCNGDGDGHGEGNCYFYGGVQRNEKLFPVGFIAFSDEPGQYYKADWHMIETYVQLNSVSNGIGIPDGHIKYWFDGDLLIDFEDVY